MYLVDLPGYGYAKRGRYEVEKLKKLINYYVLQRQQLTCLFVLIDSRLEPQKIDLEFIRFLGENGVPFGIIFTKADKPKLIVILDGVSNPHNLGAIARSAEALGIAGLLAYNCCDVYNPKALRASMGSLLRLPVTVSHDLREDLLLYKAEGFQVLGTVPVDTAAKITETHFTKSSICVIGNEGNGISQGVKQVCDDLVTIPMKGRAESLNASVAAAITMWEMMR